MPTLMEGIFTHLGLRRPHWSSTSVALTPPQLAWQVGLYLDGKSMMYHKHMSWNVKCVKGALLKDVNLTRTASIVTDHTTGLQWQDDINITIETTSWINAINQCEELELNGFNDWRLPNINELYSIIERNTSDPALDTAVFQHYNSLFYWISTTDKYTPDNAWMIDGDLGYTSNDDNKDEVHYVRCVRGGEFGVLTCPDGEQKKEGERPGTAVANPGIYLPNCESGRLVQGHGIESCDDTVDPADPPGFILPTCDEGERLDQGTETCIDVPDRPIANAVADQNVSTGGNCPLRWFCKFRSGW